MAKDKSKSIFNKLLFSCIIIVAILVMQPLEILFLYDKIPVLFPSGLIAFEQRNLLVLIQLVMLIFIIPVYIFTFIFSWWYRADNKKAQYDPHLVDHNIAEFVWWGVPLVLTSIVCVITWIKTYELDPYKPLSSKDEALKIQVVALQWKWLFIYPEEKIATVNYIEIPKDRPVHFYITADAPMNAFWIPALGGMIYAMPGMETQLNLVANKEDTFDGRSANISGAGFADMTFQVKAVNDTDFNSWVSEVKRSGASLNDKHYNVLAKPSVNQISTYILDDEKLFHSIMMKYMKP